MWLYILLYLLGVCGFYACLFLTAEEMPESFAEPEPCGASRPAQVERDGFGVTHIPRGHAF